MRVLRIQCVGEHVDYSSFPTRRSSDLGEGARRAAEEPGTAAVAGRMAAERYGLTALAEDIQDYPDNATRFLVIGQEDRKSTRLNSSHVAISYAVLCLKKINYRKKK